MASKYVSRARDAVTGRFVPLAWALLHPRRTVVTKLLRKQPPD